MRDAVKFITDFGTPMTHSAPHIYLSALPFAAQDYSHISLQFLPHFACTTRVERSTLVVSIPGRVCTVAFSPDGKCVLSGCEYGYFRIWDAMTGDEQAVLEGHKKWVSSAAFSPDGKRIVSGSFDNTTRIWDVASGKQQAVLRGLMFAGFVRSVAFSPDGNFVCASEWNTQQWIISSICIWDAATGKEKAALVTPHRGQVTSVVFTPDGKRIVSCSFDRTIRIWDWATGNKQAVLIGHENGVQSVAVSPDGKRIVSCSYDKTIRIWDTATGKEQAVLKGHSGAVYSVAFSPDGMRIVSGSSDRTIRIWDTTTGKNQAVLRGHSDEVASVAFSPNGKRILSGSTDKTLRITNSYPFGLDQCEIRSDGWIYNAQNERLFWVPPAYRSGDPLMDPHDFTVSQLVHGEGWVQGIGYDGTL